MPTMDISFLQKPNLKTLSSSGKASDLQASIIDQQIRDFDTRFAPAVRNYVKYLEDRDPDELGDFAGDLALLADVNAAHQFNRDRGRFGIAADARELDATAQQFERNAALNKTQAENLTRTLTREETLDSYLELANIGRGFSATANEAIGDAASLQAQREAESRQAAAAKKAARAQTMGAVAGLGIALLFAI